ncbi:hypothetical protein F4810DRAFT_694799 [Camillea tinctor]|nr:hypothetical protein F4810DRAFT_694799 [Camillea tinctor]
MVCILILVMCITTNGPCGLPFLKLGNCRKSTREGGRGNNRSCVESRGYLMRRTVCFVDQLIIRYVVLYLTDDK